MENIITIDNVIKEYRLGQIGGGTLKQDLQSLMARLRHKEDPNSIIGEELKGKKGELFRALDGVSFQVKQGERIGLIGHNGAGKSTLLKLLSRVTMPSAGNIVYYGRIASMLEVGTGFHPELTGRENIYLNGAILGMSKAEVETKMNDIIDFAEIAQFIDTPIKRYSSGMKVKLGFSIAAHLDAEIMIMDEVLAVGDMAFQQKCISKMNQLSKEEGRTILYVSHNMNTIRALCTRCVVLNRGKVAFDGDVESGINHYMKAYAQEYSLSYDLDRLYRSYHFGREVRAMSFTFADTESYSYECGETVKVTIGIRSKLDIPKASIVLKVANDKNTVIGSYISSDVNIQKSDTPREYCFAFDTGALVHGHYFLGIDILKRDEWGNYHAYDSTTLFMRMDIQNEYAHNIKWTPYYGSVELTQMRYLGE